MKIILLQDVKSLGKKGDLVEVKTGYARNYILPGKLGVEATPKNINDLKLQKAKEEKEARIALEAAQEFAANVAGKAVNVTMKTGDNGKLFGSVSSKEIAAAYKDQFGTEIDKKKIVLGDTIKALGTYKVPYKVHPKVTAELTVNVIEG
ncbi:MAG: 50S ribosomal protein L9 [Lachnospiraceae bacterium]|nr:50S ribosomal protein L9 [Lachnospiraceae bacterium]